LRWVRWPPDIERNFGYMIGTRWLPKSVLSSLDIGREAKYCSP
jgi:hypothetical protein